MLIEFELKKIVQELKDPNKTEQALYKLDKFTKQNPQHDYMKVLRKEGDSFAQNTQVQLESVRNGNSYKSTNNSDSLGQQQ